MRKSAVVVTVLVLAIGMVALVGLGCADAAQPTGEDIMAKVYKRYEGDDRTSNLQMTLVNRSGAERVREIKQFERAFPGVDKKILFFVSPRDVKNTAFMNWSYDDGQEDNQWIYLPALRKVKRISSENKNDYFMGSDFTYDDLGGRDLDADVHKLLRTEEVNGDLCYVVESTPKESGYMYGRTINWVVKDKWIGLKKEFYDPKGELLKTLSVTRYADIDGILTILETVMHNVQSNHRTIMAISDVQYNTGIEDIFSERMMRRGL